MKKVYQEIVVSFYAEDDVDIDEVLYMMDINIKDTTGKLRDNNEGHDEMDWEYRHLTVEEF